MVVVSHHPPIPQASWLLSDAGKRCESTFLNTAAAFFFNSFGARLNDVTHSCSVGLNLTGKWKSEEGVTTTPTILFQRLMVECLCPLVHELEQFSQEWWATLERKDLPFNRKRHPAEPDSGRVAICLSCWGLKGRDRCKQFGLSAQISAFSLQWLKTQSCDFDCKTTVDGDSGQPIRVFSWRMVFGSNTHVRYTKQNWLFF